MFSFIKKYATGISGIDIFPDISLVIFVLVFAAMLWFALRADKKYIKELEEIPLNN
ncbi:MAG: CcoQ/FixQ family Cbb3-type cytochrome c oxidase assembly chaperone [Chitinophagales bacterium]|nr:CcoQ/FixQ family Cbb3-type cytochrome c oxidase assembly chaperone [Chitinophagales bacterium]